MHYTYIGERGGTVVPSGTDKTRSLIQSSLRKRMCMPILWLLDEATLVSFAFGGLGEFVSGGMRCVGLGFADVV